MPFRYLGDPLFIACVALYFAHRLLAEFDFSTPLSRAHLNDVICIGFWVPIMLWLQRRLGLRKHDGPPEPHEIVIPLVLWGATFEVLLPSLSAWRGLAIPDAADILAYSLGALGAAAFWRWRYEGTIGIFRIDDARVK